MINKTILLGNVGADPEIRHTQDGRPIANFSLATSERWTDKQSGEKKERTEWHRVVVFNEGLCGIVEKFVRKGSKLYVEGMIQTRKWEKDGVDRYSTEIILKGFDAKIALLDKAEGTDRPPPPGSEDDYGPAKTRDGPSASDMRDDPRMGMGGEAELDDEIPF